MHVLTVNISQTMVNRTNNTIAPNIMSHVGFHLAYLEDDDDDDDDDAAAADDDDDDDVDDEKREKHPKSTLQGKKAKKYILKVAKQLKV